MILFFALKVKPQGDALRSPCFAQEGCCAMSANTSLYSYRAWSRGAWNRYLLDSGLAVVGALFITAIIYFWHLYPRIPNISIVYLLVVLALASTRGRYAAILASIVASLSFDYFIVPPLYIFTMYRVEEWIALGVFLIDAVLTGHLASALRQRAQQASRREYETRVLYDLVRETTHEEEPRRQLEVIAHAIQEVFASWGVQECAILQPDEHKTFQLQSHSEQMHLSPEVQAAASWVMQHQQRVALSDEATRPFATRIVRHVLTPFYTSAQKMRCSTWFLPLLVGQRSVGVLYLRVLEQQGGMKWAEQLEESFAQSNSQGRFFATFLDQAAALIERGRLRSENMRIELLQRTDALRSALLSSVSHDLRTPLAIIKASASSLLQEDVDWDEEERHSFALIIEREVDRLNRLVGNLLDMSRIENGAIKPEKEWYSFPALLVDVLERLHPLLQDRQVCLHVPDNLPPVELDYLHIDQVLTNLIENAVRYTPASTPIEIEARYAEGELMVSIADRGPGIPAHDLERIFDKFYRVLTSRQQGKAEVAPAGSGLGLAVCKGLVEAHGGHIWATAREGGGVTFTFTLPVGNYEGGYSE